MSSATDAAYRAALTFTLKREGVDLDKGDTGWVNNPNDVGGATNFGITQAVYDAWRDRQSLQRRSVKEIEYREMELIYRRNYWRDARCEEFADVRPRLALCHFDWSVNGGSGRARLYLQAALGVVVDGIVGPKTVGAARDCDEREVIARYLDLRAAHYHVRAAWPGYELHLQELVEAGLERVAPTPNPTQREFLPGWLARCRWVARESGVPLGASYAAANPFGKERV